MAINSKDSLKVHVAAFGKHPGWDDHIEEIGLDSALLVNAKRVIYTECLGGNIDSGVWEKLDNDKLLPFKHTFYWRTGEGLLIGRMWASRDGKGRTKYPMIVCAQIEGVPAGWAIQQVLPRLAAVEEKCAQTNSAELVRLAIGETRRSLEDAAAALVGADPKEESGTSLVARLVNEPGNTTPAGREGMVRILYEMEREFGEYKPATLTSRTRTRMGDPAAQHIRVPKSLGGPGEAARAWMALLDQEIALAAPVLVLEPEGQQYIDIIVGEPKAGQFRCLRSGEKALGLTSDVPYTMDDATKASAEAKLAAWGRGEAKSVAPATGNGASSSGGLDAKSRTKIVIAAVAMLALVVILAFVFKGKGSKEKTGDGATPAPAPSATDHGAGSSSKPDAKSDSKPDAKSDAKPQTAPDATASGGQTPSKPTDAADPRGAWAFDQAMVRAKAKLDRLNSELKFEGSAANGDYQQKLDDLAKRAQILAATPWRASSADSISHEMASMDGQLSEVDQGLDAASAGVATRVAARLQERGAGGSFQSDVMKKAWAGALGAIDPTQGYAAAKAKADAIESSMKAAESAVMGLPPVEAPAGSMIDAGALRAAATTKRDEALQAAASGAASGDPARVQQAVDQLRSWTSDAKSVVDSARQIESLLGSGKVGGDGSGDPTVADLAAKVQAAPAYHEVGPAVLPVLRQAAALRDVSGETSPVVLIEKVKAGNLDTGGRGVGQAVAAWGRLAQVGWPATVDDLAEAGRLKDGPLKAALGLVTDAASKGQLESQCSAATRVMWQGFVERSGTTDAALSAAEAAKAGMSVGDADVAKLPGWARYNLLRYELGQAVKAAPSGPGKAEARRGAVQAFLNGVDALGPQVALQASAAQLVSQLRPLLEKSAQVDVGKLGPAGAGWKAGPVSDDGNSVSYTQPGASQRTMKFQRLPGSDDTETFLGTTEVSVGAFIDAVKAANKWDEVKPLLAAYPAGGDDSRRGPRVWEWSVNPAQVMSVAAPGPGDTSHGWLRAKSTMSGQEYYPAGMTVAPPAADDPMQYVSPTAAVLVARIMGCRLPTAAEWKAAAASGPNPAPPNLRDQTWRKEYERAKELAPLGAEFPAGGIFWPAEAQKVLPLQDGLPAVDADDGTLWFSPVGSGAPGFQHLVGNVAEFVWDDSASIETLDPSATKVKAALGKGEKLHVIGGSALSPKDINPTEAQPVNFAQARDGYSDVGFRLAFSAPKGAAGASSGTRLDQALAGSGYLSGSK